MVYEMSVPKLRFKADDGSEFPEWEEKRLEDICEIIGGGTPSTEHPEYWDGNIQWFTPTEVGHFKYVKHSKRTITELGLLKSNARLLPIGTILLTTRATLGEMSISEVECCTNQGFQSLIIKDGTDTEYIYYLQALIKSYCLKNAAGSTFREISSKTLGKAKIPIPSLKEQNKIADFFSAIDQIIEQTQSEIDAWEKQKRGVMQLLFSQKVRFKADDGSEFPAWEEKKVKDLFDLTRGYVLAVNLTQKEPDDENQYPVYSSQTKSKGLLGYYSDYLYENAITWTTDGANAGTVHFRAGKFYCTNVCGVLLSSEGYANQCIAEILGTVAPKYVSYVGNPKLMNNVMSEIIICAPSSMKEQQKIAACLSAFDTVIDKAKQELVAYRELKKGLLQQMFV